MSLSVLKIKYSQSFEVKRIQNTLLEYGWFLEQGYRVNLPKSIAEKLRLNQVVEKQDIKTAVALEFNEDFYKKRAAKLKEQWNKIQKVFFANLKTLGGPLPKFYNVYLTKYGVGGSYHLPNTVILNLNYGSRENIVHTVAHEMVHLAIEKWVQKYNLSHWDKEWLVDTILYRILPGYKKLQKKPKNIRGYSKIFKRCFPNMELLIKEISGYKPLT